MKEKKFPIMGYIIIFDICSSAIKFLDACSKLFQLV